MHRVRRWLALALIACRVCPPHAVAGITLDELPVVHRSKLTDPQLRSLHAICTLRAVDKGAPVFHAGEYGNACAIVLRGVLAPQAHGSVAAAIAHSQAGQHWKAIHDVTGLLFSKASPLAALKAAVAKEKAAMAAAPAQTPLKEPSGAAGLNGGNGNAHGSGGASATAGRSASPTHASPPHGHGPDAEMDPGSTKANQLGPGTAVGVAAMLVSDRGAKVAWHEHDDVVAAEPALVAMVPKGADLTAFIGVLPSFEQLLQRTAKARLLRTYGAALLGPQATSVQAQRRIISIADRCRLLHAKGGQVIAAHGDEPHALHVVVAGSVRAQRHRAADATPSKLPGGPRLVEGARTVAPGQAFGEAALLMRGAVCDATYRAGHTGATLLQVPRHLFSELLGKDRTLFAALHIKLLRHEARLVAILAHPRARAAFAGFVETVCGDSHSLDAYESMHAYAQLAPNGLAAAARTVGTSILGEFVREPSPRPIALSRDTRTGVLGNSTLPVDKGK